MKNQQTFKDSGKKIEELADITFFASNQLNIANNEAKFAQTAQKQRISKV